MSTTPFRLLDLPFLAKRLVFQHFGSIEIFEISFTSLRVRSVELPLLQLRAIEHNIRFDEIPVIETVIGRDSILGDKVLEIHIDKSESNDGDENDERVIGCHRLKIRNKFPEVQLSHHNAEFAISVVFDYIFRIFPGPINMSLCLSAINNVTAVLLNPHFAKCKKLRIPWEYVTDESDLEQVLDLVSVSKAINVDVPQLSGLEMNKIDNLESLILNDANWMSLQDLCSLKCENITLKEHKFNINCIEKLADWWLSSNNTTLKTLQIGWGGSGRFAKEFRLNTEKLPWKPWDPKKRSKYFNIPDSHYFSKLDCSNGFDITRSDGLTATCLLNTYIEKKVMFLVWHDPFPEKTQNIRLTHQISSEINQFYSIYNILSEDEMYGVLGKVAAEVLQGNWKGDPFYVKEYLQMTGDEICSLYMLFLNQVEGMRRELAHWAKP